MAKDVGVKTKKHKPQYMSKGGACMNKGGAVKAGTKKRPKKFM